MDIPPEIIPNILYRLPAKSLGRFKCVSKDWLTQISEPQFIKLHQSTYNRHHLICDYNDGFLISLYSLPLNQHDEKPNNLNLVLDLDNMEVFIIQGSCNGLVLAYADNFVSSHWLAVFNPTTMESVRLLLYKHDMIRDWEEIDIMYGFGYDSLTDDYKVVTISYYHFNYLIPPGDMLVHVCSLRNKTWRRVVNSPYDHSKDKQMPGVLVDGFLHWIANRSIDDQIPVIVAFSLADEVFSEVASPKLGNNVDVMSRSGCKLLVVVGEKLGLFVGDEVWLMNKYGVRESWSKIIIHRFNKIPLVEVPKFFYNDGKVMLVSGDLMWIYDVKDKSFGETVDISRDVKGLKVAGSYVESLVSPILVARIGN